MKKALFLIFGLLVARLCSPAILSAAEGLVLPSMARADLSPEALAKENDFVITGYSEVGKRSTAEDYEEEGTDDDYAYQNYHLKLEHQVSERFTPPTAGLSYDIGSFIYDKDYKSGDSLDNISRLFKTNWFYYLKKPEERSQELYFSRQSRDPAPDLIYLAGRLRYKEKRYKNTPGSEYEQFSAAPTLTFKKKDLYTVDLTAGIDNYDYLAPGQKDQLKIFSSIGGDRYFLDKKLMLTGSYKLENTEQEKINRKKTKHEVTGGFDYLFDLPWLYKITTRAGWGQRDTKEDEERDEDFDYEYWRYYTKSEHKINPKLKTTLKYQYFKKDYISADLGHGGFYIHNSWDYEIFDDEKQRIGFDFGLEHKDVKYELRSGNDYQKKTAEVKFSYKRKKNWQSSAGVEHNFYDFDESSNDKKRFYAKISVEKLFFPAKAGSRQRREGGDLVLSLDLKYRYTGYEQKDDSRTQGIRLAFKYKF